LEIFCFVKKIVKEILKLCPKDMLVTLYKIPSFEAVDDFLYKVATVRGKLKKGGLVDIDAAARIVLHDWNEGADLFLFLVNLKRKSIFENQFLNSSLSLI